jgi:hypothetical protein
VRYVRHEGCVYLYIKLALGMELGNMTSRLEFELLCGVIYPPTAGASRSTYEQPSELPNSYPTTYGLLPTQMLRCTQLCPAVQYARVVGILSILQTIDSLSRPNQVKIILQNTLASLLTPWSSLPIIQTLD